MNSCVLLLSGGIDSVCTASILRSRGFRVYPLFCNYGQASVHNERTAMEFFSANLELESPRIVDLDIWKHDNYPLLNEVLPAKAGAFFLPLRNLQLAVLGAIYAQELGAQFVAFGFHASSGPLYTDTSQAFLNSVESTLAYSLPKSSHISFWQGVAQMKKSELIASALMNGIQLEKTYSCYYSSRCHHCDACAQVASAYADLVDRFPSDYLMDRNPNAACGFKGHE